MASRPSAVTDAQIWVSELTMAIKPGSISLLYMEIEFSPSQTETTRKYRFRKRDKMLFFGRKMLRKVRSFTRNTVGPSSATGLRRKPSNRLMISRLRRFLAERKETNKPRLKQQSPPQSFLEADWSDMGEDHRLPPEVLYMLRSVRVFGHLEKPFFLELCRFMETITLRSGSYLFKIGDPDDSIYVVQDGLLEVFITDSDGTEHLVKEVATGNSIHSLLSILDVLTGHPGTFRSVSARAVTDTTILRLPAHAFKSMFEKFNESAVKVVQIIMVRLQRVTFSALHNYLGLSKELLKPEGGQADLKELNIHKLNRVPSTSSSGSPAKAPTNNPLSAGQEGPLSGGHIPVLKESAEAEAEAGAGPGVRAGSEDSEDKYYTPPNQHNTPKKSNASMLMGETSDQLSDFDQALMRARVSITDEKSIVLSGSPPRARRWSTDPSGNGGTFRIRQLPDESHILSLAAKDLVQILGLKDPALLKDRLTLKKVRAGAIFCKQGDQDTSLFFLVKGTVGVMQNVVGESSKEALMYQVEPGEIIDVLAVLTGEPSFFTLRGKTDAIVVVISKLDFYQIMRSEPFIVLNVAHQTVKRMSNFVRQIDFALDWQMLEAGKALFRQGDTSDSIFIVLTGRLRSVITSVGGKKELVNEFGRGELVGIVEVLTQNERATTVLAIRDTEVTKIPSELLSLIKLRYPQVVARLIHLLGTRILGNLQQRNNINLQASVSLDNGVYNDMKMERSTVANLATIAIVPVTEDVPLTNFALELQHALLAIGPTVRLTPDIVRARLGTAALDGVNEFRLFNWLSQQEDIHRMVLYQCDHQLTKWSKHCLRQADCILIVALADKEPTIGPIEKELENIAVRAQKELVLLHHEDAETPRNTAEWLNVRGWLSSHHHLRCPKRVLKVKSPAKTLELYEKLFDNPPNRMADFSRLARFLTGTSIGLVLGGGGARGLAHVGMIKAMTEEGIPIDMVGGTSMGAFIGALWAEERQYVPFTRRAREWAMGMTSLWKKIWDLTYPMTSMFTGWAFNESIETVFRDRQIEDLWIPYFCITTNISNSSMRVHSLGSVWRYVRASMSLSGYLPPLCDPGDGHLLLDGGYVNNLPADVMHHLGANFVFAVDVGSQDEKDHTNYGDSLSGWWLLWKRWNPWAEPVKVPDMTEIQSRLAYVSCVRQLELVKNSDYCEYIRPPIDRYATLQFGAYDEIMETGYHHGKTLFSTWTKGGLMDKLFVDFQSSAAQGSSGKPVMETKNQLRNHVPVMAYFTDLAEQVSKIDQPKSKFFLPEGSEDDIFDEVDFAEDPSALMEGYEEDDEFADEDFDEEEEDDNDDAVVDGNADGKDKGSERRKVTALVKPQDGVCPNSLTDSWADQGRTSAIDNSLGVVGLDLDLARDRGEVLDRLSQAQAGKIIMIDDVAGGASTSCKWSEDQNDSSCKRLGSSRLIKSSSVVEYCGNPVDQCEVVEACMCLSASVSGQCFQIHPSNDHDGCCADFTVDDMYGQYCPVASVSRQAPRARQDLFSCSHVDANHEQEDPSTFVENIVSNVVIENQRVLDNLVQANSNFVNAGQMLQDMKSPHVAKPGEKSADDSKAERQELAHAHVTLIDPECRKGLKLDRRVKEKDFQTSSDSDTFALATNTGNNSLTLDSDLDKGFLWQASQESLAEGAVSMDVENISEAKASKAKGLDHESSGVVRNDAALENAFNTCASGSKGLHHESLDVVRSDPALGNASVSTGLDHESSDVVTSCQALGNALDSCASVSKGLDHESSGVLMCDPASGVLMCDPALGNALDSCASVSKGLDHEFLDVVKNCPALKNALDSCASDCKGIDQESLDDLRNCPGQTVGVSQSPEDAIVSLAAKGLSPGFSSFLDHPFPPGTFKESVYGTPCTDYSEITSSEKICHEERDEALEYPDGVDEDTVENSPDKRVSCFISSGPGVQRNENLLVTATVVDSHAASKQREPSVLIAKKSMSVSDSYQDKVPVDKLGKDALFDGPDSVISNDSLRHPASCSKQDLAQFPNSFRQVLSCNISPNFVGNPELHRKSSLCDNSQNLEENPKLYRRASQCDKSSNVVQNLKHHRRASTCEKSPNIVQNAMLLRRASSCDKSSNIVQNPKLHRRASSFDKSPNVQNPKLQIRASSFDKSPKIVQNLKLGREASQCDKSPNKTQNVKPHRRAASCDKSLNILQNPKLHRQALLRDKSLNTVQNPKIHRRASSCDTFLNTVQDPMFHRQASLHKNTREIELCDNSAQGSCVNKPDPPMSQARPWKVGSIKKPKGIVSIQELSEASLSEKPPEVESAGSAPANSSNWEAQESDRLTDPPGSPLDDHLDTGGCGNVTKPVQSTEKLKTLPRDEQEVKKLFENLLDCSAPDAHGAEQISPPNEHQGLISNLLLSDNPAVSVCSVEPGQVGPVDRTPGQADPCEKEVSGTSEFLAKPKVVLNENTGTVRGQMFASCSESLPSSEDCSCTSKLTDSCQVQPSDFALEQSEEANSQLFYRLEEGIGEELRKYLAKQKGEDSQLDHDVGLQYYIRDELENYLRLKFKKQLSSNCSSCLTGDVGRSRKLNVESSWTCSAKSSPEAEKSLQPICNKSQFQIDSEMDHLAEEQITDELGTKHHWRQGSRYVNVPAKQHRRTGFEDAALQEGAMVGRATHDICQEPAFKEDKPSVAKHQAKVRDGRACDRIKRRFDINFSLKERENFEQAKKCSQISQSDASVKDRDGKVAVSEQENNPLLLSRAEIHKIIFETDSDSDLQILSSSEKERLLSQFRSPAKGSISNNLSPDKCEAEKHKIDTGSACSIQATQSLSTPAQAIHQRGVEVRSGECGSAQAIHQHGVEVRSGECGSAPAIHQHKEEVRSGERGLAQTIHHHEVEVKSRRSSSGESCARQLDNIPGKKASDHANTKSKSCTHRLAVDLPSDSLSGPGSLSHHTLSTEEDNIVFHEQDGEARVVESSSLEGVKDQHQGQKEKRKGRRKKRAQWKVLEKLRDASQESMKCIKMPTLEKGENSVGADESSLNKSQTGGKGKGHANTEEQGLKVERGKRVESKEFKWTPSFKARPGWMDTKKVASNTTDKAVPSNYCPGQSRAHNVSTRRVLESAAVKRSAPTQTSGSEQGLANKQQYVRHSIVELEEGPDRVFKKRTERVTRPRGKNNNGTQSVSKKKSKASGGMYRTQVDLKGAACKEQTRGKSNVDGGTREAKAASVSAQHVRGPSARCFTSNLTPNLDVNQQNRYGYFVKRTYNSRESRRRSHSVGSQTPWLRADSVSSYFRITSVSGFRTE
ncbi:LOW QUALITY PROTEIN: neuropathy target esterase sws [Plakobranchus ocellatus]|uniref:lysophospholipase n=1 Tax=Plakobranchus ocellatus TaxID=259542 RepID=A0AAV3XSE3_9GAST|nr:LOW QUALITY PROTEIN: neuropathy target esterase sws [Plakobranchus ocellatus]